MKANSNGFVVLTLSIILSMASIAYTANMANLQLVDNQILSNYYRSQEAFLNAESGVSLLMSKLNSSTLTEQMLNDLPYTYPINVLATSPYQVSLFKVDNNKLEIVSTGWSRDRSALRKISLQVRYISVYDIPIAPLLVNDTLNINDKGSINEGCEGVAASRCRSPSNIARKLIVSKPTIEGSALCNVEGATGNQINEQAFSGVTDDDIGLTRLQEISGTHWGEANSSTGSVFDQVNTIENMSQAGSLFESSFGVPLSLAKDELSSSGIVEMIDMTVEGTISCSEQIKDIAEDTSVIYIKGDCNIDFTDTSHTHYSDSKRFSIGSTDSPKLVFMEGGKFTNLPMTGISVIGMLYFLPGEQTISEPSVVSVSGDESEQSLIQKQSIDISGIYINGALFSEYRCTHNDNDQASNAIKQPFSVRYDKAILNNLYDRIGMPVIGKSYQIIDGTWRDF